MNLQQVSDAQEKETSLAQLEEASGKFHSRRNWHENIHHFRTDANGSYSDRMW